MNEVVLFDWQTLQAGSGTSDLAYFISATLPESASEEKVNELLEHYHRVLPTIYDGNMDLSVDRGLPLSKAWLARILSRLKSVDHSELLD